LTKLLEEYLTFINFRNRPQTQKIFLLNELNLRKLEREFRAVNKEAGKILNEIPQNTMHYFFDKAMLEDNVYFFNNWSSGSKKRNYEHDDASLKSIIENFTRFYLIASLTMYRKVLYIRNYGKINIDLKFIEEILKILESYLDDFKDIPIINLYTNEILLLTKGDRKYFDTLKSILLDENQKLSYIEIYSLHNILQRFSTRQVLLGKNGYEREKFSLYNTAVTRNIIVYPFKKHVEAYLFISIVNSALAVKNTGWARTFVSDHVHLLEDEVKSSVTEMCMAKIDFALGSFETSLLRLQNIKTKHPETQFQIKVILLKIYYELSLYNEADLAIDSLRHLLTKSEKNFSPLIYESYRNFLKYFSFVIKAKEKNKKEKMKTILAELKKRSAVDEHKWLLGKARTFADL
jgi:hypothetical protein